MSSVRLPDVGHWWHMRFDQVSHIGLGAEQAYMPLLQSIAYEVAIYSNELSHLQHHISQVLCDGSLLRHPKSLGLMLLLSKHGMTSTCIRYDREWHTGNCGWPSPSSLVSTLKTMSESSGRLRPCGSLPAATPFCVPEHKGDWLML